ncbi:MAG TPA: maleylpyruvate isomerase family mycothiol-dependent enzyme [Pseudonocardiaceae bacterium]|jgi:uncharacterized protein (TIGR03083 family)|nr:maleylpyruvate isomerase family mycothiol-dependent enzyme [Pseudonocardiaceae bacterium]
MPGSTCGSTSGSTWTETLRRERSRLLDTMESLTEAEFEAGSTLCAGWTPRDVLAHVIGTDQLFNYAKPSGLTIDRANAAMVREGRLLSRAELIRRGRAVAMNPGVTARMFAWLLAGDCAMHHQDVLRGLGKPHDLPAEAGRAIYLEGTIWSWVLGAKLLRYRVIPTTEGGRPRGRGRPVRGSTEALSLWLAGRESLRSELEFD